jgi:cytidine deaminase
MMDSPKTTEMPMPVEPLTPADHAVVARAVDAARRLTIPGIQEVGAAVRTGDGQIFAAIHFESATGFATVCGEVAALSLMIAAGRRDVELVAAVWLDQDGVVYVLPPCGRCRELIADCNPAARVIVSRDDDHWQPQASTALVTLPIADLLPRKSHRLRG